MLFVEISENFNTAFGEQSPCRKNDLGKSFCFNKIFALFELFQKLIIKKLAKLIIWLKRKTFNLEFGIHPLATELNFH